MFIKYLATFMLFMPCIVEDRYSKTHMIIR